MAPAAAAPWGGPAMALATATAAAPAAMAPPAPMVAGIGFPAVLQLPGWQVLGEKRGPPVGCKSFSCRVGSLDFCISFPTALLQRGPPFPVLLYVHGADGEQINTSSTPAKAAPITSMVVLAGSHTKTAKKPWKSTPQKEILEVTDTLMSLGWAANVSLMGFSRGAWWAHMFASLRPHTFCSVVLLAPYPSPNSSDLDMGREAAAVLSSHPGRVLALTSTQDAWYQPIAYRSFWQPFESVGALHVSTTLGHDGLKHAYAQGLPEGLGFDQEHAITVQKFILQAAGFAVQ